MSKAEPTNSKTIPVEVGPSQKEEVRDKETNQPQRGFRCAAKASGLKFSHRPHEVKSGQVLRTSTVRIQSLFPQSTSVDSGGI